MSVAIIGAGIGGLTLGLCLHKLNIPFQIYEAVNEIKPLGVGINIQPHAVRELYALGLKSELDIIGLQSKEVAYFSKQGGLIWSEPRGTNAGYNWPQYSINRGDLQMLLYKELIQIAGSNIVRTNATLKTWENSPEEIELTLIDRKSQRLMEKSNAKIMIGCDGINSTIRAKLYPHEGPAKWSGIMMWRGTTKGAKFLSGRSMVMVGEKKKKFVAYPIHEYTDGDVLINWICDLRYPADYTWLKQDWNREGCLQDILPSFKEWAFDWVDIPTLLKSTKHIFEYPMVDRNPLSNWTSDRITLLGDAAHAMYPIGSNGASQAILDASYLARSLEKKDITTAALKSYEKKRLSNVNRLIKANRADGPDKILEIVAKRSPNGYETIGDVISELELKKISSDYKNLAGFEIKKLNASKAIIEK